MQGKYPADQSIVATAGVYDSPLITVVHKIIACPHVRRLQLTIGNGQIWRLYDNAIQGVLADKLVVHASLQDTTQIMDVLTTLSKAEVLSGSLERLAAEAGERKLRQILEQRECQQREEKAQRIYSRQIDLRAPSWLITTYLNEQEEFKGLAPVVTLLLQK